MSEQHDAKTATRSAEQRYPSADPPGVRALDTRDSAQRVPRGRSHSGSLAVAHACTEMNPYPSPSIIFVFSSLI